jgi:hypothetical protein
MKNAVHSAMPAPAVMMKLAAADHIAQVGKVASSRDRHVPARRLSYLAVLPFLLLGACAEPKAAATIAAAPGPVSSPAPTPSCNGPLGNQADKQSPSTPWQRAVDRKRVEDCEQALDSRLAPIRPEYVGNPRQGDMDKRTLDLAPLGLSARAGPGGNFRDRLPIPETCVPHC